MRRYEDKVCVVCGKSFRVVFSERKRKACSTDCGHKMLVGRHVGENSPTWRGGIKHTKYVGYMRAAEKRGLEFNLTQDEFLVYWGADCYYCGSKIETIGLDRIKNDVGYTITNVVPCCRLCNWMKRELSVEKFLEHIQKIYSMCHNESLTQKEGINEEKS